jgi:hypothetical protein
MAAPAGGNHLRAALQAKRWSYSRLAVELRRRAERDGVTLPKHESLVTLITWWTNNRQQPDGFYRDLLSRTLGCRRASCSRMPLGVGCARRPPSPCSSAPRRSRPQAAKWSVIGSTAAGTGS